MRFFTTRTVSALALALIFTSCTPGNNESSDRDSDASAEAQESASEGHTGQTDEFNALKNCYFGAVHVHTGYSFDAYTNGTLTIPSHAYEWAQGKAIPGGGGGPDLQIKTPLDFYAVSDHAEYMGVFKRMENPDDPLSKLPIAAEVNSDDQAVAFAAFSRLLDDMSTGKSDPQLSDPEISTSVWSEIVATADEYYKPGEFTTFPAFEWSSNPNFQNLHRVVVFKNTENLPKLAFSALDSDKPEDLWTWMEQARANGADLLAIPHNGNASDGLMFALTDSEGNALSETYVKRRMANEPLYEVTQIKGTSETHPDLSPNDEFAGFELWDYTLSANALKAKVREGSYIRKAYLDGLKLKAEGVGNPFQYGLIGDTDTHNAAASHEEFNYTGKFAFENNAEHRLKGAPGFKPANVVQVQEFSSGGLHGIWATENTRDAIYEGMVSKETFATTGTMMKVRFFGGWNFKDADIEGGGWVSSGYSNGVAMGSELTAQQGNASPSFLIWAQKDPNSGNLDRVQVVKGWVDADGNQHEKVYNVAWSGDRKLDADGNLPAVGSTVNAETATYTNNTGAPELKTVWSDPEFNASENAFYYLRVLEIPTPRWNTYDAARTGLDNPDNIPFEIQERAFSSPIWYYPG